MAKSPELQATKPENVLFKPLTVDFKTLFKAVTKGVTHGVVGKWEEIGNDTVEALSALGLATEPGELAFLLIHRSLTKALVELIGESASQLSLETAANPDIIERLPLPASSPLYIDSAFFEHPSALAIIPEAQEALRQWLEARSLRPSQAGAVAARLPSYFVYSLNQEWRRNAKSYRPLINAVDTPFTKASEREWAWSAYAALLERRTQESVFDEPFSLRQIFIPLNGYYLEDPKDDQIGNPAQAKKEQTRAVTSIAGELSSWLEQSDPQNAIRVISGGPGSGKSSLARVFAADTANRGATRVLFIPLHLIDPAKDIVDEIGRFVKDEGVLQHNPLGPESPDSNLLVIFDGLDELSSQGKAAAETARAFVREVEKTVERRNQNSARLRVILSGRELVVQENQAEFRRPRQILFLLPYFVPQASRDTRYRAGQKPPDSDPLYRDDQKLLESDLRDAWWKNYGRLTGSQFEGLPKELNRDDLDEISAQPLLNYLLALSFTRKKLDFTKDINLNAIYADLVTAVFERGYEKRRTYGPIRHMKREEFSRVLEEIGLAAWHGDGRTTTVREIEEHCRTSGLGTLLDVFQDGAKAGVTRLLAAFFFRQHGERTSGDPTFVFTHKSFGEYLAARRIARAVERVIREMRRRGESPDEGWDERQALVHWAQICGPSAMTQYLATFLRNELRFQTSKDLGAWQERLANIFNWMLRLGMPVEQLNLKSFRSEEYQSRNAEEALLVALNACANLTEKLSVIKDPSRMAFGAWFKRVQGQRQGAESSLAALCLSYLDLSESRLDIGDYYGANLAFSRIGPTHYACFIHANLDHTQFDSNFLQYLERALEMRHRFDHHSTTWIALMLDGALIRGSNIEPIANAHRMRFEERTAGARARPRPPKGPPK